MQKPRETISRGFCIAEHNICRTKKIRADSPPKLRWRGDSLGNPILGGERSVHDEQIIMSLRRRGIERGAALLGTLALLVGASTSASAYIRPSKIIRIDTPAQNALPVGTCEVTSGG